MKLGIIDQKEAGLAIRVTCQASLQLRLRYEPEARCHDKAAIITEWLEGWLILFRNLNDKVKCRSAQKKFSVSR